MGRSILKDQHREALRSLLLGEVVFDEPMRRRTTLRIGGPADALCTPTTIEALAAVLRLAAEQEWPVLAVGGGSNLLVRDGGIRGLVIATRKLKQLERVGQTGISVQSGVSTGKVLSKATEWELGGVEFLGGVPGSLGGGLIMNAGTYLGEFKDVCSRVHSLRISDGTRIERTNGECKFEYRRSALPRDEIVVEALLELKPRARDEIVREVRSLRERRKEREPTKVSNSGSTFKNPPGDFAGRLIEACGLKGRRVGGAECSPTHANWLVNTGDASAQDLLALIDTVRALVAKEHGVTLELELKVIGED
jgi:UDP-N-acetylmuramate dehydrogenase